MWNFIDILQQIPEVSPLPCHRIIIMVMVINRDPLSNMANNIIVGEDPTLITDKPKIQKGWYKRGLFLGLKLM